ncbi:fibronectin type III domain-containing protein [Paenibacillus glufosinatiresistens]|uniref:fibronectin type III domain-containing protein n=1 Tax=Paenibacillus glufosinatiresistens TaxID=3070657 RepID=UPI00286D860B|nr:LamG-like jellyroll fold domain-containing protein [Paenibacillus sp. YX.27]
MKKLVSFALLMVILMSILAPGSAYASSPGTNNATALSFPTNGTYAYINQVSAQKPASAFTIQISAYSSNWSSITYDTRLLSTAEASGYDFTVNSVPGYLNFYLYSGGAYHGNGILLSSLNRGWHTFTGTFDGRYQKLYVDGILKDTNDYGSSENVITYSNTLLILGGEPTPTGLYTGMSTFNGYIDDLRMYKRALSADEVGYVWNRKLTGNENGLVGLYRFDVANSSLVDDSPTHNNGFLNSAVRVVESPDLLNAPNFAEPTAPSNLEATVNNGYTNLAWSPSTKLDQSSVTYNIFVDGVKVNSSPISSPSYTVTGLTNDVTHSYYVVAYDLVGTASAPSDTVTALYDSVSPAAPRGLAVKEQTEDSVTLIWNANTETDLAGYRIYMNGTPLNVGTVTGTTYTVAGLDNQTTYSFYMTAIDTSGNQSSKSNTVTATLASTDRALLTITLNNGFEKEYDLSMAEVNAFITWYEAKAAGTGPASFAIDKHNNNKGPFKSRKDYVVFDKILTFEINVYTSDK